MNQFDRIRTKKRLHPMLPVSPPAPTGLATSPAGRKKIRTAICPSGNGRKMLRTDFSQMPPTPLTQIPVSKTDMIGETDAHAKMPKLSTLSPVACIVDKPRPSPIAITNGTVIGPVVTPAESHATHTYSSEEIAVSSSANVYPGMRMCRRSHRKMRRRMPMVIPANKTDVTIHVLQQSH
eukprot:SAG31_NODE_1253_length_9089_cov_17.716765_9_plen_179_part_00